MVKFLFIVCLIWVGVGLKMVCCNKWVVCGVFYLLVYGLSVVFIIVGDKVVWFDFFWKERKVFLFIIEIFIYKFY